MKVGDKVRFLGNDEPYFKNLVGAEGVVEKITRSVYTENEDNVLVQFATRRIGFYRKHLEVVVSNARETKVLEWYEVPALSGEAFNTWALANEAIVRAGCPANAFVHRRQVTVTTALPDPEPKFKAGDVVRITKSDAGNYWVGHLFTVDKIDDRGHLNPSLYPNGAVWLNPIDGFRPDGRGQASFCWNLDGVTLVKGVRADA